MSDKRIFIALDISDAARAACAAHIQTLRQQFPEARISWERPEKLHITLKFLGTTSLENLSKLEVEIGAIARRYPVILLSLSKCGVFPSVVKPRILWVGVREEQTVIGALHAEVEQACAALGYEIERRHFRPHITIGRIKDPRSSGEVAPIHSQTQIEPVRFEAAEIVIYESKLQPSGSIYSAMSRLPFEG